MKFDQTRDYPLRLHEPAQSGMPLLNEEELYLEARKQHPTPLPTSVITTKVPSNTQKHG